MSQTGRDRYAQASVVVVLLALGLWYLAPWVFRNIPFLISTLIILGIIFLIIAGTLGRWRARYAASRTERRKARIRAGMNALAREIHAHPGHLNAGDAARLVADSYRYLDEGNLERAVGTIKYARSLLERGPAQMLAEAGELDHRAGLQFSAKRYARAQNLWQQSLARYDQAEKFARHEENAELVGAITRSREAILGHLGECIAVLDRQQLAVLVDAGDRKVKSAERYYQAERFDQATSRYAEAGTHFRKALSFAEGKGLVRDEPAIRDRIARTDSAVESVILGKARALIREAASSAGRKNHTVAENYYQLAVQLLEKNPVRGQDPGPVLHDARRGLVTSRIEQGKEMMRGADRSVAGGQFLAAKEAYDAAREYLNETTGLALRYNLASLQEVLVRLVAVCTDNSEAATGGFIDSGIPLQPVVTVDSLESPPAPASVPRSARAGRDPRPGPARRPLADALPAELRDLYPEWEYLGKGGFARVFKARRADGTLVAVKIPLSPDTRTGKTFIAEMQTWKRLNHPNIVKVYDFNIMPVPYIEEELCDSALALLKKPVEPEEAAWILFNICDGLKCAHAQKIVHRDLKPQNILFRDGVPKISDWGLSRVLTEMTTATSMAFTLTYAAPEQITHGRKDERTDIWQIGVISYELLTGILPFAGESMVGITKDIATLTPKRPGEIHPPAAVLDGVVMRCLEKEPRNRYESVQELQKALSAFLRISYTESLKRSTSKGDHTRSADLIGALVLTHLRTGDLLNAYTYLLDLLQYARGSVNDQAQELSGQIKIRIDMGLTEVPDELIRKAEVIVHTVSPGSRKMG